MKTKIYQFALFLFVQCAFTYNLYSQSDHLSLEGTEFDPAIQAQMKEDILVSIQTATSRFAEWAVFPQAAKGKINDDISNYVSLFEPTAKIVQDYLEGANTKVVDLNTYVISIKNNLGLVGLPGSLYNPKILSMHYDAEDKNVVLTKITITRKYTNYLDESNQSKEYSNPNLRELEIVFATPIYYTQESLIRTIQPFNVTTKSTSEPQVTDVQDGQMLDKVEVTSTLLLVPGVSNTEWNDISESNQAKIKESIATELGKYLYYGHLMNDEEHEVTPNSINNFRHLFNSDYSLHVADFDQYQESQLGIGEYCSRVYQELKFKGVEFELLNPQIESVKLDPAGYYTIHVTAVKKMKSYVDFKTKKPSDWKTPKDILIQFEYELGESFNYVHLMEVKPLINQKVREESRSTLALLASFGSLVSTATPNADWHSVTDNVEIPSSSKIGIGIAYSTNSLAADRSTNKPLFLSVGVNFNRFTITSSASDLHYSKLDSTVDMIPGVYDYDIQFINDDIDINLVELPIGVDYRVLKPSKGRLQGFLGIKLLPSYVLSAKHTYTASPFYNLSYNQYGFDFYSDEKEFNLNPDALDLINSQYGIGDQAISDNGNEIDSKFIFGFEINADVQITLSSDFILIGGIKYQGYTSSFIEHDQQNPEFPFLDRPQSDNQYKRNSLLQDFYTEMTSSAISVFTGVAYKLH